MNILLVSSSPRAGESCAKQAAAHRAGKLQQGHPDADANEIFEARRALVAELERRRRAAALTA